MYVNLQIITYIDYFYVRRLFYTGSAAKQSVELWLDIYQPNLSCLWWHH